MHFYVTRHGKAHPESPSGLDEDRALRGRGERQAAYLGERLKDSDHTPTIVYSSGLLRAEQTADIVAKILGVERAMEPVLGLGHRASDVVEVLELIRRKDEDARVMLVGHNPQLESLVSILVQGPTAPPHRMRTGTCVVMKARGSSSERDTGLIGAARLVEVLRYPD